jgi:peptidoglycan/xylan/chitin deacetylase (PgdA/CDA1 family)
MPSASLRSWHEWMVRLGPIRYPGAIFRIPSNTPAVYLTFDDGPCPKATSFVLDTLEQFGAKATFFLVGKNVQQYPDLVARIRTEGHLLGGHSMHHENGWDTPTPEYVHSARESLDLLEGGYFFRPPYGRLKKKQHQQLAAQGIQTVFWDVLSYDYDTQMSPVECLEHTRKKTRPGSVVVFHDSQKALPRLQRILPELLIYWRDKGWIFQTL